MTKYKTLTASMMLLAGAGIAGAATFSDVLASHWAYQAVIEMAEKGIVQGFPNGTFKGNENVSRYQLAMITARMLANIEQNGTGSIAKNDLLKNNDKHHFRLAYDHIINIYDGKDNTFNRIAGNPLGGFINDLESNVVTFTYTYRLAENTRLKLGYQNAKVEAKDMPDQKVNLYFTELYSKF